GVDVAIDVYPYTAGSTILAALLPPWANDGGIGALLERLASPATRGRIPRHLETGLPGWPRIVDPGCRHQVRMATATLHPEFEGMTVAGIAEASDLDPVDVVADLLIEEEGCATVVVEMMAEEDVERVLASPLAMIGSDGIPLPGKPHPRWAGTF